MKPSPRLLLVVCWCGITSLVSGDEPARTLIDFPDAAVVAKWRIVNDGVMGGRSTSQAEHLGPSELRFSGELSLENNGGFASVRSQPTKMGLKAGDVIVLRVRGDGRKYTFNLYVPRQRMAFSYRTEFATKADEWTETRLPLDRFQATSFGRPVRGVPLAPDEVNAVGILLGDKQAGPFQIVVDWIKLERSN